MLRRFLSPPAAAVFRQRVWELARRIPPGRVATYGGLAALLAPPPEVSPERYRACAARWVGGAMATCPADIPWHRVVNSRGRSSLAPEAGGREQYQRLAAEGVVFTPRGAVDLARSLWRGEPAPEA